MRNDLACCSFAAVISFIADAVMAFEVNQTNPRVVRNQIPNFFAVCQNEQLDQTFGLLLLEARNRSREPRSSISRET
jgi:hypothetical protein